MSMDQGETFSWMSNELIRLRQRIAELEAHSEGERATIIAALEALDPVVPWEARNHSETVAQRIEYLKSRISELEAEREEHIRHCARPYVEANALTPEEAQALMEVTPLLNNKLHRIVRSLSLPKAE